MKKLMYLMVAVMLSVFAACGGACSEDCAKECCTTEAAAEDLGCKDGGKCLADHSCCAVAVTEDTAAVAEDTAAVTEEATEEVHE